MISQRDAFVVLALLSVPLLVALAIAAAARLIA